MSGPHAIGSGGPSQTVAAVAASQQPEVPARPLFAGIAPAFAAEHHAAWEAAAQFHQQLARARLFVASQRRAEPLWRLGMAIGEGGLRPDPDRQPPGAELRIVAGDFRIEVSQGI